MKTEFIEYPCEYFSDIGVVVKINREKRRRTISLQIKEKFVLVAVPKFFSNDDINKLIADKSIWIRKKIIEKESHYKKQERNFVKGEKFFLYGSDIILDIINSQVSRVFLSEASLNVFLSKKNNNIKKIVEGWYKEKSLDYLVSRTSGLARKMCINYSGVKVKNFKRRLGSCSHKGEIVYNWRIIMSPKHIIDYIIIHELCHTVHFNHSKKFWNLVKEFSPSYQEHKVWLKKNFEMLAW